MIRNTTGADRVPRDTLKMLRLHKKYTCVLVQNDPSNLGMIKKVKDYVAYGEVDDATISLLEQKRGKKDREGKLRKDFHLQPPKGGFERKGIKHSYTQGGALGYRGDKINALIKKMI
ncbi:uL30 family ribosomal protein [Candidatus Woesearchaeota archaeon]|nr:uL30 family ribosomal protein [Candidatus Woesearchaeota archaeon]